MGISGGVGDEEDPVAGDGFAFHVRGGIGSGTCFGD